MADIQQKTIKGPVRLTGVHSSGRSIAPIEGKNHYLDFGIPGEEVTFFSHRNKQGFRSGEVVNVTSESPYRVAPFCTHYGQCNGCDWQHIDYEYQLSLKLSLLNNALKKYDIVHPPVPPVIPSPEKQYYRQRMEYSFSGFTRNLKYSNDTSALGFHRQGEPGNIIDIKECFLQQQPSRAICDFVKFYADDNNLDFYNHFEKTGFLRSLSIRLNSLNEVLVIIGFSEERAVERQLLLENIQKAFPQIISLNWTIHLSSIHSQLQGEINPFGKSTAYLYEKLGNYRFRVHASSFFQPNNAQAENIFNTIREWTDLSGSEKVYDLYTGVGTIPTYLASNAGHITGIEGSFTAIDDAIENACLNNIDNVAYVTGDILETFKPEYIEKNGKPDLIILDPPRSGTLIEIKKTINSSGAKKVVYLSCNPVSLAFDLKQLTEAYKVTRIQPFDMLPHTHHLETLVMMERS